MRARPRARLLLLFPELVRCVSSTVKVEFGISYFLYGMRYKRIHDQKEVVVDGEAILTMGRMSSRESLHFR
jgi:hypothetical protein